MAVVNDNEKRSQKLAKKLGVQVERIEDVADGRIIIHFDNGFSVRGYPFDLFVVNAGQVAREIKRAMLRWVAEKEGHAATE